MKVRSRFGYRFFSSTITQLLLKITGRVVSIFKNARTIYIGIIGLIVAVGVIWGIDIRVEKSKSKQETAQSAENVAVLDELGKLVDLPVGETPVIATIIDKTKLSDEPFFAKAVNDDVVVMYPTSKVAYIFRPSNKKIIDFTRVAIADDVTSGNQGISQTTTTPSGNTSSSNTSAAAMPIKIKVFNGNATTDYSSVMVPILRDKYLSGAVVTAAGLAKGSYTENIVCDPLGAQKAKAEEIALMVGGSVNPCPAGEDITGYDIIVILSQ